MPVDPQNAAPLVLVTPVFNDQRRLADFGSDLAHALAAWRLDLTWVIADDGSRSAEWNATRELAAKFAEIYPATEVFQLDGHAGKGGTVRAAWDRYPDARWLGFVDADGSVSPSELRRLFGVTETAPDAGAILGVRDVRSPDTVWHNPVRLQAHRVFAQMSSRMLALGVTDTQCGAKILAGPAYRTIAPVLQEDGFIFDCELLAALKVNGFEILEQPVAWVEQPGGQVMIQREAWRMTRDLLRVRRRMLGGELQVEEGRNP